MNFQTSERFCFPDELVPRDTEIAAMSVEADLSQLTNSRVTSLFTLSGKAKIRLLTCY
jgi:hypothetical protein